MKKNLLLIVLTVALLFACIRGRPVQGFSGNTGNEWPTLGMGGVLVKAPTSGLLSFKAPELMFHADIYDQHHKLVTTREGPDMVTTQGATALITYTLKNGGAITMYCGEIKGGGAPTFDISDALDSHAGWTAIASGTTDISDGNYPTLTLGSTSGTSTVSADNSASKCIFHQNSTITLQGFYVTNDNVVGDNAGGKILYGENTFTGGSAAVQAGYEVDLTVTVTTSAS